MIKKNIILKAFILIGFIFQFLLSFSQNSSSLQATIVDSGYNSLGQKYRVQVPSSFHITGLAREWNQSKEINSIEHHDLDIKGEKDSLISSMKSGRATYPEIQLQHGLRTLRTPLVNFDGQIGDNQNNPPPDPSGAAGPNHYVQAVNNSFQVFNKTGDSLTSSVYLSFFSNGIIAGDPIVMYDRHADRWVISYLKFSSSIVFAVSQTNDPTGAYFVYSFNYPDFPDYPKFSVWWDGYYMAANALTNTAAVFERTEMLAGNPSARFISLMLPSQTIQDVKSSLPSDADGPLPPNGTPCNFFLLEDDANTPALQDQIKIYEMITDWITPSNSQVAVSQQIPISPFDGNDPHEKIPQPITTQLLDGIEGIFMYRAQHRRWVGYNTILLTHTVDVGSNTAIRWYELRDNNDGIWYQYQYGTYMPDNAHRWLPSIAMDDNGSIGLAFSYCDSATTKYPGIHYTGRLASDPLGQMTFSEEEAMAGQTYQYISNRYGDYSALALDPDGNTFWHTSEYIGSMSVQKTRIYSFQLEQNTNIESYSKENGINVSYNNNIFTIDAMGFTDEQSAVFEIIGIDGKVIASSKKNIIGNQMKCEFNINLNSGIYFVRVYNSKTQKCERVVISN